MIDRFEHFSCVISDISRYWHKIASEEMAKYGLKGPHAIYLTTMNRNPHGITAAELCELCGKDKADVSRMMTIMESKGLVIREGNKGSLYRAKLKLTETGVKAAEQVSERAALATYMAGKGISEQQRTIFYDTLEQISINLEKISKEGLPNR